MPGLPVIPDVYRVALNWVDGVQSAANVIHMHRTTSTASQVATTLDASVTAAMWGVVESNAHVTSIHVTPLDGSSATFILATSGAKWTGSGGAGDFSPATAAIVSLRTVLRGRSNRGRVYLPFIPEITMANGSLSAGVAGTQTAWNTFLAALVTATQPLVVASYKLSAYHEVSSALVETVLATQRRRQQRLR